MTDKIARIVKSGIEFSEAIDFAVANLADALTHECPDRDEIAEAIKHLTKANSKHLRAVVLISIESDDLDPSQILGELKVTRVPLDYTTPTAISE